MNLHRIACVIVTYNRKELLKNCLIAVAKQSYKPEKVYIVDNASTDGTIDSVNKWGYKDALVNDVYFEYILMPNNQGGAGGFYWGMKAAYDTGLYDAIWVMDDDGVPALNCLEKLVPYLCDYHFISPMVVDNMDFTQTSFMMSSVEDLKKRSSNGILYNVGNPFNGVVFSTKLIDIIGFPKKEMFIWGDEMNYTLRARHVGMFPIMIIDALHFHPRERQDIVTLKHWGKIRVTDTKWKMYCLIRNSFYNEYLYDSNKKGRLMGALQKIGVYASYALLYKHDCSLFLLCLNAIIDGYCKNFNNLYKYLKK